LNRAGTVVRVTPEVLHESAELAAALAPLPAAQQPEWPDAPALDAARASLAALPPLVFAGECDQLTDRMAAAARGEAFVLQGGDCAEVFADTNADAIKAKIKTLLQMSVVLTYGAQLPVVKVGRMAGQFAKPRSSGEETRDGVSLPSYRGDAVNGLAFTPESRRPDPQRLVEAYHRASATLNLIRAFTQGGYADLRQAHEWNKDFVRESTAGERYERIASDIDRALAFMHACGIDPEEFRRVEFYSGHEALLLDYELPLTRIDSRTDLPYDVSSHFLWIGERTRQLDGAHIAFAAAIRNPIGVKLGPTTTPEQAVELVERLDPTGVPGRLSLISRMGASKVRDVLPAVIEKVEASGHQVVWICDPMHGNTIEAAGGQKTRRFDDVMTEVEGFFAVHSELGTHPGGLHIELTGDDVTECLGGAEGIEDHHLGTRYETACDPRLNRQQALELSFLAAEMLAPGTRLA
jgi:3-deoxy-7-phosphoheptulonate synthase